MKPPGHGCGFTEFVCMCAESDWAEASNGSNASMTTRPKPSDSKRRDIRIQHLSTPLPAKAKTLRPRRYEGKAAFHSRKPLVPAQRPKELSLLAPAAPTLHHAVLGAAPEPPRSLPVVPLSRGQRYYGEAPVGLWIYERSVGDAYPPITPKTAKNPLMTLLGAHVG